jgi:hypothetical protein
MLAQSSMAKNSMTITLGENPEFDAVFAGKQPGDKCKFEVKGVIKESDSKSVTVYIDDIEYDGEPKSERDSDEEYPKETDPVLILADVEDEA